MCGTGLGTLRMPAVMSPLCSGRWVTITDVVPMMTAADVDSSAPAPTAEVIESMVPGTAGVPTAMPSSEAAAAHTSPATWSSGTIGASLAGSSPVAASSSGSCSIEPQRRLSHTS